MTRILGLDLSLQATGVAWGDGTEVIDGSKLRGAHRLAHVLDRITVRVVGHSIQGNVDIVVIEGPGYFKGDAVFVLELHGVVKLMLWDHGIPFAMVPPAVLKKFATGKGNADKAAMMAAAIRSFGFAGDDENEADAFMLREMGRAHYDGAKHLSIPRMEALEKVEWPVLS